jgi:hypothetical protein
MELQMPSNLNLLITLAALLALAGCVTTQQTMVKQGYPAGYAQGFDDGCHSGRKAGGSLFDQFKKDVRRFESDKDYASGWSDAFRQCESQQENAARQARMVLEQQRLNELRNQNKLNRQHELEREALKGVDTSGLKGLK